MVVDAFALPQSADVIGQERLDIDHVGRQVVRGPPGSADGKLIQRKPADQRKARHGARDGPLRPQKATSTNAASRKKGAPKGKQGATAAKPAGAAADD